MTVLLIILLLAVVAALWAYRNGQAWARHMILVAALVGMAVSIIGVKKVLFPASNREAGIRLDTGAGRVLGEEILRQLPAGGDVFVLLNQPVAGERSYCDERLTGLRQALSNSNIRLVLGGVEVPNQPSSEPGFVAMPFLQLDAQLADWLGKHPEAKAVVSLLSYPPESLYRTGRPLFGFAARQLPSWEQAMARGTFKAALVDIKGGISPNSIGDWKDFYQLVTPETLAAYQRASKAKP